MRSEDDLSEMFENGVALVKKNGLNRLDSSVNAGIKDDFTDMELGQMGFVHYNCLAPVFMSVKGLPGSVHLCALRIMLFRLAVVGCVSSCVFHGRCKTHNAV